jgi:hypothetical protein
MLPVLVETFPWTVVTVPERVVTVPERVDRLEFVVLFPLSTNASSSDRDLKLPSISSFVRGEPLTEVLFGTEGEPVRYLILAAIISPGIN